MDSEEEFDENESNDFEDDSDEIHVCKCDKNPVFGMKHEGEKKDMTKWFEEEKSRIEKEKLESMQAKGLRPFLKLEKGETQFLIEDIFEEPKFEEGTYGEQAIFKVKDASNVQKNLAVNPNGKLYSIILNEVSSGNNFFKVMKSGTGKDTRYELLQSKKV